MTDYVPPFKYTRFVIQHKRTKKFFTSNTNNPTYPYTDSLMESHTYTTRKEAEWCIRMQNDKNDIVQEVVVELFRPGDGGWRINLIAEDPTPEVPLSP